MSALAPTLEAFFSDRLINEKGASPHTIAAYRDTFRLLLSFAQKQTGRQPSKLELEDLDAPLARSSTTSNATAATAPAPATPGWRRSTRCSTSPRFAIPSTRR
jgi:site-specific recombinase XerC